MAQTSTAGKSQIAIAVRPPFDLAKTLRFILGPPQLVNGRTLDPLLDYFEEGEYRRVAEVGGDLVLYSVSETSGRDGPRLIVRLVAGSGVDGALQAVAALVERQFSAGLDISPFYEMAHRDPAMSRLVQHFCGMRIPQSTNPFETLVSAILEQQINLTFAHKVKKALVAAYGRFLEYAGRRYCCFPEPAALAIVTPKDLLRLQISGPKARYIIGISRAVLDGTLDLESLRKLEPPAAHAKLISYKGVGPWTAQYVGMRALGHLDSLPAADVGLQKAVMRFYGLRKMPSAARVTMLSRSWAAWRSYATFYLWLTFWEEGGWNDRMAQEIRHARRKRPC